MAGRETAAAGQENPPGPPLSKLAGGALAAGSVACVVAGWLLFARFLPRGVTLVSLQWAGSSAAAVKIAGGSAGHYRLGLSLDLWALLPGTTAGLLGACYLGRKVFLTRPARGWARAGLAAAGAAFALTAGQDALLLYALGHGLRGTWIFRAAQALSFGRSAALIVAAITGVIAVAVTAGRLATHHRVARKWGRAIAELERDGRPVAIPPAPAEAGQPGMSWWGRQPAGPHPHWEQGFAQPATATAGGTGICVSGGGIRSASVTLGALQALREAGILADAGHLVSVSGGGYTAGGLQLAQMPPPGGTATGSPDVFGPGSVEEDHLRRHSSYLSADARQWALALAVLLRGVVSSFVVIGLTVITAGLAIGAFYHAVPALDRRVLGKLKPYFLAPHQHPPRFPPIPPGVALAIGGAVALAALGYLTCLWLPGRARLRWPGQAASRVTAWLTGLAVLLAALGVALPAVIWVSSWLTWQLKPAGGTVATAGTLSLVLTYAGAVAATLWRKRAKLTGLASGTGEAAKVVPDSMFQLILLWICLIVLILAALLLGSWVTTSGLDRSWWALAPPGALAAIALFLDQTAVSLHPFYRQRLASAFAVRRESAGGCEVAAPYPYSELTPLSRYARRPAAFPAVAFAATANIKGQDRTPSGRPAESFTFTSDYVGGPRTGWVRTDFLDRVAGPRIRRDLTVEAAMAVSGAAFASAMGGATRFFEVFLALTNARLGAWLPNPGFVARKRDRPADWTVPGLPRLRRLSYFAREIFGTHPGDGRMLLCTDGGHYDNLGLVEVLRRRCEYVICIDASGGRPPLDDTLAAALALAREELGVTVTFTSSAFDLTAGGWDQLRPAASFAGLNSQLSKNAVIVGDISYPEAAGSAAGHGTLIFAQAVLTPGMPYQLLDFPQYNPFFPKDGTADQWFDIRQFDAYQELGRAIGELAAGQFAAVSGASRLTGWRRWARGSPAPAPGSRTPGNKG